MTYSGHNNLQVWQYWYEDFKVFFCNFFEESERNITRSSSLFGSLLAKHYNCTNIQPDKTKSNLTWPQPDWDFFQLCAVLWGLFFEYFRVRWRNSFNQICKNVKSKSENIMSFKSQIRTQRALMFFLNFKGNSESHNLDLQTQLRNSIYMLRL